MRVTAINRIKTTMQGIGKGKHKSVSFCWCEVLGADRFRAYSSALHCIALRHAALEVFLAFRCPFGGRGRALSARGGCMHAVSSVTWPIEECIVRSRWNDMER